MRGRPPHPASPSPARNAALRRAEKRGEPLAPFSVGPRAPLPAPAGSGLPRARTEKPPLFPSPPRAPLTLRTSRRRVAPPPVRRPRCPALPRRSPAPKRKRGGPAPRRASPRPHPHRRPEAGARLTGPGGARRALLGRRERRGGGRGEGGKGGNPPSVAFPRKEPRGRGRGGVSPSSTATPSFHGVASPCGEKKKQCRRRRRKKLEKLARLGERGEKERKKEKVLNAPPLRAQPLSIRPPRTAGPAPPSGTGHGGRPGPACTAPGLRGGWGCAEPSGLTDALRRALLSRCAG